MTEQSVETVMLRAVNLALDEIGEYWCSAVSWEPKGVDDRVTFLFSARIQQLRFHG